MSCHSASSHEGSEMDAPQATYMGKRLTRTSSALEGANETNHGLLDHPNERRRNRLGYHRSTVACDPCRKRKIRCKKPEVQDLLNRCESCISLKKDCVYTAVNPQAQPHTMTHRPRRVSIGSNPASPTTSPATAMGHIVERQSNPAYHQLTAMPSMPSIGRQPVETGEDGAYSVRIPSTTPSSRSFSYGQVASGWMSTDADAGAETTSGATNTPWMTFPHGVPETTGFSQYTSHTTAPPLSAWPASSLGINRMDTETHLDDTWRPYPSGPRSMSFNSHQSEQFDPSSTRPYDRVQSPSATNIMPEASLAAQGSLSAGATPHLAYDVWQQQYHYSRHNEDYGGWYEIRDHPAEAHVSSGEDPSQIGGVYYGQR
ncbi:hypothetical protein F4813DRAFT_62331 [Daldinia decipiens]|uniref:uncharacterized protein n=1 Tax=Daldinia decipiens TaxID=326647 RepID=UPI0020C46927|nr:uncharacterized protein F4813DRAFT_62331 [Daldinia decipiens]KAI1657864.1 hypothetical protein F4813DRAFT_62331 [Daldinia decipiens]